MPAADTHRNSGPRKRPGGHPRRSVWVRVILLLAVLAAIFLLPKLAALFSPLE